VNRLGGSFEYYSDEHPGGFGAFTATPEGPKAIANAIKDMRALTSLDISNQVDQRGWGGIGAEGAKHLAEALKDHA
jgi:hypothetical protein